MRENIYLPAEEAGMALETILNACSDEQRWQLEKHLDDAATRSLLEKGLAASCYLQRIWAAKPALLLAVLEDPMLQQDAGHDDFVRALAMPIDSEAELDSFLRRQRQLQMGRFILRDVNRLCSTARLISELSLFADAAIDRALQWHYQALVAQHGQPVGRDSGDVQQMVVLGMGKLGAGELNLSSDIDLIFSYPEAGQTDGRRPLENQQFFTRLGQKLIKTLDKITIDGFVFRVDMRLRPYGQSGALALNFDAMELYYEDQGREWERYAMIKARCVAGDQVAGAELLARLKPFVYRKYTDFSAILALREMKALINREVRRLGKHNDVKLGAGGIREIEFIAQAYQLIYGGRDENLQQRSVIKVLQYLGERQLFPGDAASQLVDAYYFLRNVEHLIQAANDEQTQRLPEDAAGMARIAFAMGFADVDAFMAHLDERRDIVRRHFADVVADQQDEDQETFSQWQQIWLEPDEFFAEHLVDNGFDEQEIATLLALKNDPRLDRMEPIALGRLNTFMPHFLCALAATQQRGDAVSSLVALIESVLRRTAYLLLLNENPKALERLITLAAASPWSMQQLARHPVLLDELITDRGLGYVPEAAELKELLRQQGLRLNIDDMEGHMQMLRYFRLAHHLHIVAAEASGKLPLMKVSDYLTFLAEAILEYVLDLAWLQMVEKHGYPTRNGESRSRADFAIIGYGKLGGIELSHSSDLDLIFLYDSDDLGETDGDKPLENRVFFTRMGQRIIHLLTTRTMLGPLYEVDMRLRPSGGKGLLVSTVTAFEKYQQSQAWTWEHQALVRARAIAGSPALIDEFYRIRNSIMTRERQPAVLRREVVEMREKMHEHLAPKDARGDDAGVFHLKHSRGGIVDIEFMVQYAVLAYSHAHPAITRYSDNIRILESLSEAGLMADADAQRLIDVYREYRAEVHKLALLQQKSRVPADRFVEQRHFVQDMWSRLLGSHLQDNEHRPDGEPAGEQA